MQVAGLIQTFLCAFRPILYLPPVPGMANLKKPVSDGFRGISLKIPVRQLVCANEYPQLEK